MAEDKLKKYSKDYFKVIKERDDLQNELGRKEKLAKTAVAARGYIMNEMNEERQKNEECMRKIDAINLQLVDADNEVKKFKAKHDEMFQSVSGLNARIEELEQHKLHLLDKLKSYVSSFFHFFIHLFLISGRPR